MRIAWVHSFPPGDSQRGAPMRRLAPVVAGRGHELKLLYTGPLTSPRRMLAAIRTLCATVDGADIVHAQYGSGCAFVASHVPGRKVVSIRGSDWYGFPSQNLSRALHSWMGCRLTRMSLPRYHLVLASSDRMRGEIREKVPRLRVETLPSGIDLRAFRPMDRAEARAKLGKMDTSPWVLFAQPSRGVKRAALAHAAVDLARRDIPDLQLMCIEKAPLDEVRLWINASHAVLLTSTHEGWPNIIKEALACGVPFISTDVSDLRDIARLAPACQVTDATPLALARGLVTSITHGASESLRVHARPFDLEAIGDRLVDWYRWILEN